MKIFQTCGSYSWGGLEIQTLKISLALKKAGEEVTILCPENSTLHREAIEHGMSIFPVFRSGTQVFQAIWELGKIVRREQPEVIHTHLSHDLWTVVPALKLSGSKAKLFLTKRMGSSVSKKDPLHRILYNRVSRIYAISNYIKENVLATCPAPEQKVKLWFNAIPLEEYNPVKFDKAEVRREFHIDPRAVVVGMVGRFSPMKGHPEFYRAAKQVLERITVPVTFLVVGGASYGEDDFEKQMHRLGEALGIDKKIIYTGHRTDVPRLMAAMDILAFPSHKESFGNILLEAMAMKLPVVASASGGVLDIVLPGETGLLVPPKDADALAEALLKLIDNPQLCLRLGEAARKRVVDHFNFENYIRELIRDYSS